MTPDNDWTRLARYFAGECPAEEAEEIRRWLKADPERQRLADELRPAWDAAATPRTTWGYPRVVAAAAVMGVGGLLWRMAPPHAAPCGAAVALHEVRTAPTQCKADTVTYTLTQPMTHMIGVRRNRGCTPTTAPRPA